MGVKVKDIAPCIDCICAPICMQKPAQACLIECIYLKKFVDKKCSEHNMERENDYKGTFEMLVYLIENDVFLTKKQRRRKRFERIIERMQEWKQNWIKKQTLMKKLKNLLCTKFLF